MRVNVATDFACEIDLAKVRIERNLDEALSGDAQRVRSALTVLKSVSCRGRQVAGVFLMGFLVNLE
ncbi:MAG TPA: hypothetical protein VMK12_20325, partial [Anaeromyxobacteraceae bacterium]|nr:hypothetical protein [Anaeromyxobacteraceae bacterium]